MADQDSTTSQNATQLPNSFVASSSKHKKPLVNKILLGLVALMSIGVVVLGVLIATQKEPQTTTPQAHVFGKIEKCGVEIGGTVTEEPTGLGRDPSKNSNTFKITYTIRNKRDSERKVRIQNGWFACLFNDQETCPHGSEYRPNAKWDGQPDEINLNPNQEKTRTVTAMQPEGACGMFQIDINLLAVYKDGQWDETCNNNDARPGIGGLYWNSDACGAPTPTPTPEITNTPTPTVTPTPTGVITNTPTPTPTEVITSTPTPTPTATTTPTPTVTPQAHACGYTPCSSNSDCNSGLICITSNNNGPKYCAMPQYQQACEQDPSAATCCNAPTNTPTPTEIIIAKTSETPSPTTAEIPSAGVDTFGKIFSVIAGGIIILGLLL